jgi:hypothetical protein
VAITSLAPGRVPARRVLTEARERFDRWRTGRAPEPRTPPDPVARESAILEALRARLSDPDADVPPPDEIQIRALARFALETCASVSDPTGETGEVVDLVVEGERTVGLAFVDASDARRVWRRLERLLDSTGGELDRLIVVRDARVRLPQHAPKTTKLLDRVTSGEESEVFRLEPETLRELRAARTAVDAAAAGDLTYRCGGEAHVATREEVLGALRRSGLLRENALVSAVLEASR